MVLKSVLQKTVGIFEGITRRKLKLEEAPEPSTDGTVIGIPMDSPDAYELLEKELARLVFHSDALVRQAFVDEYLAKIVVLANRHAVPIHEANVSYLVGSVYDVLEMHRVLTLWSKVYAGSSNRIRALQQAGIADALERQASEGTQPSVLSGLLALSHDVPYELGPLENLRPYLEEALSKVSHRSEKATLWVSRWLISSLVNQIIRDALGLPPPEERPGTGKGQGRGQGGASSKTGGGASGAPSDTDGTPPEADTPPQETEAESRQPQEQEQEQEQDDDSSPAEEEPPEQKSTEAPQAPPPPGPPSTSKPKQSAPWHPPPVQSLPREKLQALNDLANHKAGSLPEGANRAIGDVTVPPIASPDAQDRARTQAEEAGKLNTNDPKALEDQLEQSSKEAGEQLEDLEKSLQDSISNDDWLTKETSDTVVIQDVYQTDGPVGLSVALSDKDAQAVKQLRLVFRRVKGQAERVLDDTGTEVDVNAYIERHANHDSRPVFRSEARGRGFSCLLLIDLSGTMSGDKTVQAERAYKVLRAALDLPGVHLKVWGFNSLNHGTTNLYRFERGITSFVTSKSPVEGFTPLHTAIDLAVRELRRGTEHKVLFVLSDGLSEHFNAEGQPYGRAQLQDLVRQAVQRGIAAKVRVVGSFIGELEYARVRMREGPRAHGTYREARETEEEAVLTASVSPPQLAHMFGSSRNWKVLDPRLLGEELVSLVSEAFLNYLRNG